MAKVTPSIAGLASIFAKAPDITVDRFFTVVIIKRVVPINAPKVVINFPTINIAGPNAATNKPEIQWINKVHERLTGFKTSAQLPALEEWSLTHIKDIERQEKQNNFYNKIG